MEQIRTCYRLRQQRKKTIPDTIPVHGYCWETWIPTFINVTILRTTRDRTWIATFINVTILRTLRATILNVTILRKTNVKALCLGAV